MLLRCAVTKAARRSLPALPRPTHAQLEEAYRSIPGKKERSEAVGVLRQLARDAFVQPHLWQRVQQLEGGAGDGSEAADGADGVVEEAREGEEGGQLGVLANGGSGSYDHATVSMALKVREWESRAARLMGPAGRVGA